MRSLFQGIAAKGSTAFAHVGDYQYEIEQILYKHYGRVFVEFGDDFRYYHPKVDISRDISQLIKESADKEFRQQAVRQSRIITATNVRQLDKIRTIVSKQIIDAQLINPNITVAKLTNELYSASILRRVDTIATYETQWSAEFSKANEVKHITDNNPSEDWSSKTSKRWDAVGDDKMRRWHADADSTIVAIDEPFTVNGEQLMYPGDGSLGATASNLANCRCSVFYAIADSDLI